MPRLNAILLSLAALCGSALSQSPLPTGPAVVSYVEGQASLEGHPLSHVAGSASLQPGQYVATGNGKVEIVLAPGVFLRVGDDSTVQMVAADATHTEVRLEQGRADVEAVGLPEGNNILIDMKNGQTHLLERGLYSFNDAASTVRVFEGKAESYPGADLTSDIKAIEIKGGHELALSAAPFKPRSFDKDKSEDALYLWGDRRSGLLTANYAGDSGYYPGYSSGYWGGYGYPYYGYGLYAPYGYGFYGYPYYAGGFFYGGGWGYRGGWGGWRGGGGIGRPGGWRR
ncbi:FecR family protein [Granulicella pectinivorans]|jgi:hypothetical protein|uniref:FecR family protein n=1 Tax=Granulicella pectinivorans TaxID=474950 RepID=A0A1I6MZ75_9BACT|nr:FecR domain-containing protein [Granulicella pectinivorans]SFS20868.1 FecR family protein [Granulicella pectinivorans]